jgi:hypothetical protein
MCCSAMSASVQWVAIRATDTPRPRTTRRFSATPDSRRQEHRQPCGRHGLRRRRHQLAFVLRGEPLVEGRATQPIAMGHLDDRYPGRVQPPDDSTDKLSREYRWAIAREPSRNVVSVRRNAVVTGSPGLRGALPTVPPTALRRPS